MLARSTCYNATRIGVVFRQVCCCIKPTGLCRASISYIAKFLVAGTLYSKRDFQVFNYLSSYPCNQDFLLFKNFLSFLLIFYSKYYRAKPSLWIISLYLRRDLFRLSLYPNRIKGLYFFLQKFKISFSQERGDKDAMSYYLSLGLQFLFSFKGEAARPDLFIFNQKICIIFLCCCKENILLFSSSSYRSYNWLFYLQFGHKSLINCISYREDIQRLVLLVCNQDQSSFLQLLLFPFSRDKAYRTSSITSCLTSKGN